MIQTTPYIGHPAYKAMGGRAAYTLATALFIGSAGLLGYFGYFYYYIPKATVFPILIFIGLEITSQSFHATARRHYPAIVFGCLPAIASLVMIIVGDLQGQYANKVQQLDQDLEVFMEEMSPLSAAEVDRLLSETQAELRPFTSNEDVRAIIQAIDEWYDSPEARKTDDLLGILQSFPREEAPELHSKIQERVAMIRQSEQLNRLRADVDSVERTSGNPAKGRIAKPDGPIGKNLTVLKLLSGGFIVTSLIWASGLAMMIDRRMPIAAIYFILAAVFTLFGVIHSPLSNGGMFLPWQITGDARMLVLQFAVGYLAIAAILLSMAGRSSSEDQSESPAS